MDGNHVKHVLASREVADGARTTGERFAVSSIVRRPGKDDRPEVSAGRPRLAGRNVALGAAAASVLAGGYVAVVAGLAGWPHLQNQIRDNWWLLVPLLAGFAVQVALMLELRRRHRLARAAVISVGTGAGVSGAGMLACCAHHLAELAPLAGATGVSAFLTGAQRPLMYAGVALNALAIGVVVRKLRRVRFAAGKEASCAH